MSGKVTRRDIKAANRSNLGFIALGMALSAALLLSCMTSTVNAALVGSGDVSPLDPNTWTSGTTGYIGKSSAGTVTVDGGSQLRSYYGYLGFNSGSSGTATVTGSGSKWINSSYFNLGCSGTGTLNIKEGGLIDTSGVSSLGVNPGSSGTATVTGVGSRWISSGFSIGSSGSGTLNIEAGGQVSTSGSSMGYQSGAIGTVTVNGLGSKWTNNGNLFVGIYGTAKLNVEAGGEVSAVNCTIGQNPGSIGMATITGTGSRLTNSGFLYVGGTLTVSNGGSVVNQKGIFTSLSNLLGNGTIVTNGGVLDEDLVFDATHGLQQSFAFGTGGTLSFTQDGNGVLGAGYRGNGTLRVADGRVVPSSFGQLGYDFGSCGTATVTGNGSKWVISDNLRVGFSGCGGLNIEAGGLVNISSGYLSYYSGSVGIVTVTGVGSTLSTSGNLNVGVYGTGTLNIGGGIVNDGLVTSKAVILANYSEGIGNCNINGGTLQVGTISKGTGSANFNWNDGTIRNYDPNTDLTVDSANNLILKLASTGTHAFNIDAGRTGTIDAVLSDATSGGTLTKQGAGLLTLTAANTYSGKTTVEAGRFKVTGSILNTSGMDISAGATLELAKTSGSATASSLGMSNAGTVLISAGSQTVGTISGAGITQVNPGATLTAKSIVQDSLFIGTTGANMSGETASQVPEPSTWALLLLAAIGGGLHHIFSRAQ